MLQILFEDNYLLALYKPAGLSSESGTDRHPSAETWAQEYLLAQREQRNGKTPHYKPPFVRAAHRLDRPTSGVLLFAKTKAALSHLMAQFEARSVEKIYRAITEQVPEPASATLRHWLKRAPDGRSALVFDLEAANTQPCSLQYTVLEKIGAGARLEIRPETGRFHQIRAQLAHAGWPIVGDVQYGGQAWLPNQLQLHARRLSFLHPKSGEEMVLEAKEPW